MNKNNTSKDNAQLEVVVNAVYKDLEDLERLVRVVSEIQKEHSCNCTLDVTSISLV